MKKKGKGKKGGSKSASGKRKPKAAKRKPKAAKRKPKAAKRKPKAAKRKAKPTRKAAKKSAGKAARKPSAKSARRKKAIKKPARPKTKATARKKTRARSSGAKKSRKSSSKVALRPRPVVVAPKKTRRLSKQVLEHFRQRLLVEKRRVFEEMNELAASTLKKSISDQAGENSRYTYHMGDVASLSYGREFSMGLAERQQNYLEQIDDALQRVEDGTYGVCKVTGELIPKERLEEVPVAKYSVRGKEILAQRRRYGGDERFRVRAIATTEG